ncbi:MAG: hypothetical protein AB1489_19615 [Acidobacteriota bacterium]
MNDDYLWDGTGEPDPEIEHLEDVLSRYRYQPSARILPMPLPVPPPKRHWYGFAAAAALILLTLMVGLWFTLLRYTNNTVSPMVKDGAVNGSNITPVKVPVKVMDQPLPVAVVPKEKRLKRHKATLAKSSYATTSRASQKMSDLAVKTSIFDVETAEHIEKAQLLLRSIKNSRPSMDDAIFDLSYERDLSQRLLIENVLLRNDAQARGNIPIEDLLSTLEPFLLDIANLESNPSLDEVRSIQERIEKNEIIAALQIYTVPPLNQGF